MRDEFIRKIEAILPPERPLQNWQARLIEAIMDEYEFKCPAFVYAGPGHQSRHTCEDSHPHPIEGEHRDFLYEWVGTSVEEEYWHQATMTTRKRLVSNAEHRGDGRCGH